MLLKCIYQTQKGGGHIYVEFVTSTTFDLEFWNCSGSFDVYSTITFWNCIETIVFFICNIKQTEPVLGTEKANIILCITI